MRVADADTDAADPQAILGVGIDADQAAISLAYRKLAKRRHSDLNRGNAKAEARFKLISAANELQIGADALPVVLPLLEQLYDLRRRMRELAAEIDHTVPEPHRQTLMQRLEGQ